MTQVLSQGEIEQAIMEHVEALEALTEEYAAVCERQGNAEADYRIRYHTLVASLASQTDRKMTAGEREARATVLAETELREYKLATAVMESTKQALYTRRTRLDALRTLAANVRAQT